jgi:hypothetical protein
MADPVTVSVQLVPAELDQERINADLVIFSALLAALVVVVILKWLINYLMAGGRDD